MLRRTVALLIVVVAVIGRFVPAPLGLAENDTPQADDPIAGNVFVMTNSTNRTLGNQVVMYNRFENGRLDVLGYFPTGGLGSGPAPTSTVFGSPVPATADGLGSSHGLILSEDQRCLFGVNAGSDTIFALSVFPRLSLRLIDVEGSRGVFPVSLALQNDILYVLNAGREGTIAGFSVRADCMLIPLAGSSRSLAGFNDAFPTPEPGEVLTTPAQVSFTPDGAKLVVSIKGGPASSFGGRIIVYDLDGDGLITGDGVATEFSVAEDAGGPFSFFFDKNGHLYVTLANSGTIASYRLRDDNTLQLIDGPVHTGTFAPCWEAHNEKFAYIANIGSIAAVEQDLEVDGPGVISAIRINQSNGTFDLIDDDAAVYPNEVNGNHAIDIALIQGSAQGPFLYGVEPRTGTVQGWKVNADGSLTDIGRVGGLFPGVDPNSPTINDFTKRCFIDSDEEPVPECEVGVGSAQAITGF
jgi:6-phosphogluconolactonase